MKAQAPTKPLVFACSGCSLAGRFADELARLLDRRGTAEMSCLAGIGAQRPSFIAKLTNREAWIIDGCPIDCARGVFEQAGKSGAITRHIRLYESGMKKNRAPDDGFDVNRFATQIAEKVEPWS